MNGSPSAESSGTALKLGAVVVLLVLLLVVYGRFGGNSDEGTTADRESLVSSMRRERIKNRLGNMEPESKLRAGQIPESRPELAIRNKPRIGPRPGPAGQPLTEEPFPKSMARSDLPERARAAPPVGRAAEPVGQAAGVVDVHALASIALTDPDPAERLEAVATLGASEDPAAIPVLAQALSDEDEEVRMSAVVALADFTDEAPVEAVERALNDPSADVRYEALEVLGEFGDERARRAIEGALQDPDEEVRWLAESLLEEFEEFGVDAPR